MYKAMYVRELGSGDAQTFTFECADFDAVKKIKPPKNRAGNLPAVYFDNGHGWRVVNHQREELTTMYPGWRDLDAIYDSEQGRRNRRQS
jgi:hypothetical protein